MFIYGGRGLISRVFTNSPENFRAGTEITEKQCGSGLTGWGKGTVVGAVPSLCRPGKGTRPGKGRRPVQSRCEDTEHCCAVNKWGNYAEHCGPQNWLNLILETTLIASPGLLGRLRECFLAVPHPQGEYSTPSSDTGGKSSGLSNLHQLHGQLPPPLCNGPDTRCFWNAPTPTPPPGAEELSHMQS